MTTSGTTINRFCSSGLQAVAMAAQAIIVDGTPVAIGGGLDSISLVQPKMIKGVVVERNLMKSHPALWMPMIDTADNVAERYNISRERLDSYALRSQQRTAAAQEKGFFDEEIVPMECVMKVKDKETGEVSKVNTSVTKDECNKPDTTIEGLAKLPAIRAEADPKATVSAGNASQLSDGASACVLMDEKEAERRGLTPLGAFKGFAVGNPYTNVYSGTFAGLATYWGHQLISKPTWDSYSELCIDAKRPAANAEKCEALVVQMYGEIGNLNPYALDFPVCTTGSPAQKRGRAQRHWLLNHMHADASPEMKKALGLGSAYEPCADDYTETYLNLPEVRKAIHVNSDVKWGQCSRTVRYSTKDSSSSMVDFYPELIESGANLNILVYSGDDDSVCATIGTQSWIWDLGYKVSGRAWRPYVVSDQTAGYLTKWKDTKMALLTVHGAGHEVPTYKPNVALDMFSRYLNGEFTDA